MKATHSTKPRSGKDLKRAWHLIDAKGRILGRIAPEISSLLQGKNRADYVSYLDCGDNVVVVNAAKVSVSGRKANSKIYTRYSGYPGGLKTESYANLLKNNPSMIITHAVSGMLPKNKFRSDRLRRLYVFAGQNHNFADKFTGK